VGTTKLTVDGNIDAISFTGDGGSLTGIDTDPANELQTLSRTGTDVMLSAGGGSVSVEDDDASSTNELNTGFELNGTTLEITDTGSTKSVDLAALTAPPLDSLDGLDGLACNGGTGTLSLLYRNDGNDRLPVMRCVVGDPCAIVAAIDDPAPISAAYAIGLCSVPANGGVIDARYVRANGDPMAHSSQVGILTDFGPNNLPREGATMLALSTGRARDATDPDACGTAHCEGLGVGAFPSAQFPVSSPACPDSLAPWDDVGLELTVRAPADATGLSFDFQFFSFEYRDGLCSTEGNDHFVALMGPPGPGIPADGNIALQDSGFGLVPINVQLLTWKICLNGGGVNTCTGVEELTGTGFDTWEVPGPTGADTLAGSSDWVTATAPVVGGQELTLRFAIWEGDDGFFDSTVLIDNFQWVVP
jgi:hypothetical protein